MLVAEDDEDMLDFVTRVLRGAGYHVLVARDGIEAAAMLEDAAFDVFVSDIRMPGLSGTDLMRQAIAKRMPQPVILMTAFGSISSAVQAMRDGAYHYLAKPFVMEELLRVVADAAYHVRQLSAHQASCEPSDSRTPRMVSRSQAMADVLRMANDIAASQATVLITGSSGTGKEVLARTIHGLSPRVDRAFVPVDCHAIPETLLESELFGHKRGAFTGAVSDKRGIVEQADNGTLFLDEIGNLPASIQAKLLRFLQDRKFRRVGDHEEHTVSVRVISATNSNLRALVERGVFREDLFYRLSVIHLELPPLCERKEDISALVHHFIRKFNVGYHVEGIRPDCLARLTSYAWPGNVRELENVIERAVILRKSGLIQPRDLPSELAAQPDKTSSSETLEQMERRYIQQLLSRHKGNQSQVARVLGINRRTLYRKLRNVGLGVEEQSRGGFGE